MNLDHRAQVGPSRVGTDIRESCDTFESPRRQSRVAANDGRQSRIRGECRMFAMALDEGFDGNRECRLSPKLWQRNGLKVAIMATFNFYINRTAYLGLLPSVFKQIEKAVNKGRKEGESRSETHGRKRWTVGIGSRFRSKYQGTPQEVTFWGLTKPSLILILTEGIPTWRPSVIRQSPEVNWPEHVHTDRTKRRCIPQDCCWIPR